MAEIGEWHAAKAGRQAACGWGGGGKYHMAEIGEWHAAEAGR